MFIKRLCLIGMMVGLIAASSLGQADSRELRRTPIVRVVEQVRDSVVNISAAGQVYVQRPMDIWDLFLEDRPVPHKVASVGSGFVMHEAGYIVTNAHVVAQSRELWATFANGQEYKATPVVISDTYDLAVLRIKPEHPLTPIRMGRSDDLMIGETTVAVGNPLGYAHTVTSGIISALHRKLEHVPGNRIYEDLIQTDASINPGNSGGPLLNIAGELIGITTAIRSDAQNIGFAIPVDRLKELLPDMLDYAIEEERHFELGMRVEGADPPRVVAVSAGGLAEQAGIQPEDELVRVGDTPVQRDVDFYIAMLGRNPGQQVALGLRRDGRDRQVDLTLKELPRPDGAALALAKFGMVVEDLSAAAARRFGVPAGAGVLVTSVQRHSPAQRAGVRPGDLLVRIGSHPVRSLDNLGQLLEGVQTNDPADLRWYRIHPNGDIWAWESRVYSW